MGEFSQKKKKALILSDGRKGHLNQSVAFCKFKDLGYEICEVGYKFKGLKILSYLLDFLKIYIKIFSNKNEPNFKASEFSVVIGAGSTTYYPVKFYAKKFVLKSATMMIPKGYRDDFDLIFVMEHDYKSDVKNGVVLPINLNLLEPKSYYKPAKKAIGIVIGGSNKIYDMKTDEIKKLLFEIKDKFKEHEFLITTSPRTPTQIEEFISEQEFDFKVIYSQNPINPIWDFMYFCQIVFITQDSTSMISEAVSNGVANIEIIKLDSKKDGVKYNKFILNLAKNGYLHIYDGKISSIRNKKIDLKEIMKRVNL